MRFNARQIIATGAALGLLTIGIEAQTPTQISAKAAALAPKSAAPKPAGMTNQDVIDFVKAGATDELILTYFATQQVRAFDLSPKGVVGLKTAGVSDRIISTMLGQPLVAAAPVTAAPAPRPLSAASTAVPPRLPGKDNVMQPHEAGIYAFLGGRLTQLEPTVSTSAGADGKSMMGSALTMGFKKLKVKASIRGAHAMARVADSTEFYFYGSGSFNPNQFILVRLESGDDGREIVVGEAGMTGVKQGARDEDQLRVQITKLESGIYKVVTDRPLTPGEYAFVNMSQVNSPSLWDFGVDR